MAPTTDLDYIHKFLPADAGSSPSVTLLLLHGTGGDENALLSLGKELWPGAALLGLRGKVLGTGMPPSFRRFTEVCVEGVKSRTEELAQFIGAASERYGFSKRKLIVVGYSNGANLSASLILLHPTNCCAAPCANCRCGVTIAPTSIMMIRVKAKGTRGGAWRIRA